MIILEESLGATFVQSLGGLPVTPELEKLKEEGVWFENLYATGTRSVRGIEAVVAGLRRLQLKVRLSFLKAKIISLILPVYWRKRLYHTVYIWW